MKSKLICLVSLTLFSGCSASMEQLVDEADAVRRMSYHANVFSTLHSGHSPSNLLQIYNYTNVQQLVPMESFFEKYGPTKGFENSVLEKYVFPTNQVVARRNREGTIVMMSAQPFPSSDETLERALLVRGQDGHFGMVASERLIQQWFAEAGANIPEAPKTDPIPRPPRQRTIADMSPAEIDRLLNGPGALRLETNSVTSPEPRNTSATADKPKEASTNALVATTEAPSAPPRWWLPVAVLAGLGVIAFLLLRARRRV